MHFSVETLKVTRSAIDAQSEARSLAYLLQFVNPAAALATGIAILALLPAWGNIVSGTSIVPASAVLIAWGAVLQMGNALTGAAIVLRGFGVSASVFRTSKSNATKFWFGFGLLVLGLASNALGLFPGGGQIANFGYSLALVALGVLSVTNGLWNGATELWHGWKAMSLRRGVEIESAARQHALCGAIYLNGGVASGVFRRKNLEGAPLAGSVLLYGELSAKRGSITIGSPGSSKTRGKMYPDLYHALKTDSSAGALVFITKRRAADDCRAIARLFRAPNQIHVIGAGEERERMNITSGMSPESIGDALQDGLGASHSDFWKYAPAALCESIVRIAQALAPAVIHVPAQRDRKGNVKPGCEEYDLNVEDSLAALPQLVTVDRHRLNALFGYGHKVAEQREARRAGDGHELERILDQAEERIRPLVENDAKLGEELRQTVIPQLDPFVSGPMRQAFCDRSGIDLALLEQGHVILIEVDEAEYPRAVGTVVRMVFRRIVQMARERTQSARIGSLNPILLLCDEYGNYGATGHLKAWNVVRESNICASIGITSLSALASQLGGDMQAANAMISNFGSKFFFDTDDKATRDLARELIGQAIAIRRTQTDGTSKTHGTTWSGHAPGGGSSHAIGTSDSESASEHLEYVLDGPVWRSLGASRDYATAIAFVRTEEGILTDVVRLGVIDPAAGIWTAAS